MGDETEKAEAMEPLMIETGVIASSKNDEDKNPSTEQASVAVRVVAPGPLPPGYKLAVQANGVHFDVLVPKPGVKQAGEVFEAVKYEPGRIEGRFHDGICDCKFSSDGGTFEYVACCCSGLAYAAVMEKLDLNWTGCRVSAREATSTFKIVATLYVVYLLAYMKNYITSLDSSSTGRNQTVSMADMLVAQLVFFGGIFLIAIFTITRRSFREIYKIPERGGCVTDCLISYFCTLCSVCQMFRHMSRSGDRPHRFQQIAEAEIV